MKLCRKDSGSIALEAALIMPLFLVFVLSLITLIKISIIDIALSSAVSETTKQIAAHMYPVDLLYQDYEHYSFLIPPPLLEVAKWELYQRNSIEDSLNHKYNQALNRVFKPLLNYFVDVNSGDIKKLNSSQLTIEKVTLPNLSNRSRAIFGIEAKYQLTLPIPFFRKIIYIRKRSLERVWVGA
ncbi:MAG TPA: TadE family protein [Bacilli bacterium]